jgi:hypothetical protein
MVDYEKTTGILLIVVVGAIATILQLAGVIDVLTNLTDVFFWIAAAILGIAFGLLTRSFTKRKPSEAHMSPPEEIPHAQPENPIHAEAGWTFSAVGRDSKTLSELFPNNLQAKTRGLEVYTRGEIEQEYPFDRFVSQVKHGGELVIMAGAFAAKRYKTDTIKRLITEKNVTVTILLLAPFPEGPKTVEIESDFNWKNLTVDIETTLTLLCKLRKELKELRNHLIIRTYDRTPTLSMIVIDPNTDDAIMQVGTYLSGTDASARFQIILYKRAKKDVFEKYWAEYELIRDKHSHEINYRKIESEFLT